VDELGHHQRACHEGSGMPYNRYRPSFLTRDISGFKYIFFVALTRARKSVWLFTWEERESGFLDILPSVNDEVVNQLKNRKIKGKIATTSEKAIRVDIAGKYGDSASIWLPKSQIIDKLLKPFLKLVTWKLELIFLPPYSPELNPAEDLWKFLREKCTHDTYYEHFRDKIAVVRKFLVKCKMPSEEVRSRCNYK